MPDIGLKNIRNYVFNDLNMEIFDKELLVVTGPNGAGKSTLLATIAGLVNYSGTVLFDGVAVDRIPTNERKIGYLFQNLALFPHLNVASNIGYGMAVKGDGKTEIAQNVGELLMLMRIEHLRDRYPKNLSGGERQRVALARALAVSPEVLLLDEPFNSMDNGTCQCMRKEIRKIQKDLGTTMVLVTHNPKEAEEMGDRIITIAGGKIRETETECFCGSENTHNAQNPHNTQNCAGCTIDCYCKR
ncbi:MAG: ABC transporter [Candidatus Methanogaster sp.]|uniref:ABC transporter n=1 Tax=Candidatus Methanogaster sp. TaxID=3386292 RepID=A0AC61L557_9EURY|nr:MAG: ABC transporter [ANME-2 cluster archaeon]